VAQSKYGIWGTGIDFGSDAEGWAVWAETRRPKYNNLILRLGDLSLPPLLRTSLSAPHPQNVRICIPCISILLGGPIIFIVSCYVWFVSGMLFPPPRIWFLCGTSCVNTQFKGAGT